VTGGHSIPTTARHSLAVCRTTTGGVGMRCTSRYRVRRDDLASRVYRSLPKDQWKPAVFATARLLRLCELTIMTRVPGVSLGTDVMMRHLAPAVRGSLVTVTAECIARQGLYWDWQVEVRDTDTELLAECTLRFVADIDPQRYQRRLSRKIGRRARGLSCWLCLLDVLALLAVMVSPIQIAYVWHDWFSRLVTETALVVGWLLVLAGVPCAISDWCTVRRNAVGRSGPRHR
jgi:predicted thioesterase